MSDKNDGDDENDAIAILQPNTSLTLPPEALKDPEFLKQAMALREKLANNQQQLALMQLEYLDKEAERAHGRHARDIEAEARRETREIATEEKRDSRLFRTWWGVGIGVLVICVALIATGHADLAIKCLSYGAPLLAGFFGGAGYERFRAKKKEEREADEENAALEAAERRGG